MTHNEKDQGEAIAKAIRALFMKSDFQTIINSDQMFKKHKEKENNITTMETQHSTPSDTDDMMQENPAAPRRRHFDSHREPTIQKPAY